jgi:hypothetical protein
MTTTTVSVANVVTDRQKESWIAGLTLLSLRGVLLWLLVPLVAMCWLPLAFPLRRKGVTFGRFLGWADLNLVAALERSILRPLVRQPIQWTPARAMLEVTHRVGWLDPA